MAPPSFTPQSQREVSACMGFANGKTTSPLSDRSEREEPHSMGEIIMSPYSISDFDNTQDTSYVFTPENKLPGGVQSTSASYKKGGNSITDPFSTTQPRAGLNAAASAFTPCTMTSSHSVTASKAPTITTAGEKFGANYLEKVIATSERPPSYTLTRSGTLTRGSPKSRVLKVVCETQGTAISSVRNYLNLMDHRVEGQQSFHQIGDKILYIRHSNIADAIAVYDLLAKSPELGKVQYYSPALLGEIFQELSGKVTGFEGEIIVTVKYPKTANGGIGKHAFEATVRELLKGEGSVCAWQTLPVPGDGQLCLNLEYQDIYNVIRAVVRLNGKTVEGEMMTVKAHHPDVDTNPYIQDSVPAQAHQSSRDDDLAQSMGFMSLGGSAHVGAGVMSPYAHSNNQSLAYAGEPAIYGAPMPVVYAQTVPTVAGPTYVGMHSGANATSMVPYSPQVLMVNGVPHLPAPQYGLQPYGDYGFEGDLYGPSSRNLDHGRHPGGNRGRGPHRGRHGSFDNKKNDNVVTVEFIQAGTDVRTTVMLRNIPNKMDQNTLKSIVDETSFGKYDFMYLRIDFSNDCNVGYAFINFIDPLDIIPFVKARAGRRWYRFRSEKVAEVSYATIQGRDCLIQKFRNSSVMLEKDDCRPKLYYTLGDPLGRAGMEEEFPESDNPSKLKRSCENAEHVGLFAPAAGQHYRNEQRHRQSLYDRGTTMAARERGLVHRGYDAYAMQNASDYYHY